MRKKFGEFVRSRLFLTLAFFGVLVAVASVLLSCFGHFWAALSTSALLVIAFSLAHKSPGVFRVMSGPGEEQSAGAGQEIIWPQVLLLAGLGVSLLWLLWGFYACVCPDASANALFCKFIDSQNAALGPLLVPFLTGPLLLYWWTRRDRHRSRELAQHDNRLATERFSRAVELLGSEREEVKLGAIYALEGLARESFTYHWTVMEILAAYVRKNSPLPDKSKWEEERTPPIDIQAALTVIGRREAKHRQREEPEKGQIIDLRRCDLRGANFARGNFAYARFDESVMTRAELWEATLTGTNFGQATLTGAKFWHADLSGTEFWHADLTGVNFRQATLSGVNFRQAKLDGANFLDANLTEADFERAKLTSAQFTDATLNRVNFRGGKLKETEFGGVTLTDASFNYAILTGAIFEDADLTQAEFIGANLTVADFSDVNLTNAIFKGANLGGAKFEKAILTRTDFREAGNITYEFTEEQEAQAIWPAPPGAETDEDENA